MDSVLMVAARSMTVLVVEDEALVAINLEFMLGDLGHRVIGPVMRIDRLQALIDAGIEADAAILDVNIGGTEIYAWAEQLHAAGIALVFATGYGRSGVREAWRGFPVIQKPYSAGDIARGLDMALEDAHRARDA